MWNVEAKVIAVIIGAYPWPTSVPNPIFLALMFL
jgi:hypothetical protein